MDTKQINELIKRLAKDDADALDKIYDLTKDEFLSLIKKHVDNDDLICEIISVSYLMIYKNSKFFVKQYDGFEWMCDIVEKVTKKYCKEYL